MVVIEAAAAGTPSVVVRDEDNAATELIEEGVNGFVAPSASPEDLAARSLARSTGGIELRRLDRRLVRRATRGGCRSTSSLERCPQRLRDRPR